MRSIGVFMIDNQTSHGASIAVSRTTHCNCYVTLGRQALDIDSAIVVVVE